MGGSSMSRRWLPRLFLTLLPTLAMVSSALATPQIWAGRTFAFAKTPFANPNLATSQDRITPVVWITRGSSTGLYNIHLETFYTHNFSPSGTEWATGDAVNHA